MLKNSRHSRIKYPRLPACSLCEHFGGVACAAGQENGYPNLGRRCKGFRQRDAKTERDGQ